MNSMQIKKHLRTIAVEFAGCLLIAVGVYNFAVMAEFPITGFSGIAIILYRLYQIPIGVTIIALNLPVAALCYRLLGKRFFFRSLWCMLLSSAMIDYLAPRFPAYEGSRMLAAICCGVIAGAGYAMIYMVNSSTGGSDFIVMAVKALRPHLSLGKISFCSDVIVVLAGGFIFRDVDGVIYGMIVNYLFAVVVDKMMNGVNAGKVILVVTNRSKAVVREIEAVGDRGATVWEAKGGYQGDRREIVMCACANKQVYHLRKAVKAVDPASFVIVLESDEVHGEGFSPVMVGEKASSS